MATTLQIKRTSTANLPAGGINSGELVYVYDTSITASGEGQHGQRLYLGNYAGTTGAPLVVGGKYFTDMLNHTKGTLIPNAALIADSNKKINEIYVSDLQLYDNKIVSTTLNTDIEISPNNNGRTVIDNLYLNVASTPTSITEFIQDIAGGTIVDDNATIDVIYDDPNNQVTVKVADAGIDTTQLANGAVTNDKITDGTIANIKLVNDDITLGTTTIALGATSTTLAGLESLAVDQLFLDGNTIITVSPAASLDIKTYSGSNTDINLIPDGTGVVKVPANYELRSGFNENSLVNKKYVDAVASGLEVKESVTVATTVEFSNVAYDNNAGTLTGPQEVLIIDNITLQLGDRVLVKDQGYGDPATYSKVQNGIYEVTTLGVASSTEWVLTRAEDANESQELNGGSFFFVEQGDNFSNCGFVATHNGLPTFGTTEITFEQFSGAGQIDPGAALSKTGNTLDVEVDNTTIEINNDALRLKDQGITNAKINNFAQIVQSKLSLNAATVRANATNIVQSDLGVVSFDSAQFTTTDGWATVYQLDGGTYA